MFLLVDVLMNDIDLRLGHGFFQISILNLLNPCETHPKDS